MSFQRLYHAGQCSLQSFAAYPVGCLPHHDQRLSDRLIVDPPAPGGTMACRLSTLPHEPDGVLSVTAREGNELIEHPALVSLRRLCIPVPDGSEHFGSCSGADVSDHIHASVALGNTIVRQRRDFGNISVRQ